MFAYWSSPFHFMGKTRKLSDVASPDPKGLTWRHRFLWWVCNTYKGFVYPLKVTVYLPNFYLILIPIQDSSWVTWTSLVLNNLESYRAGRFLGFLRPILVTSSCIVMSKCPVTFLMTLWIRSLSSIYSLIWGIVTVCILPAKDTKHFRTWNSKLYEYNKSKKDSESDTTFASDCTLGLRVEPGAL